MCEYLYICFKEYYFKPVGGFYIIVLLVSLKYTVKLLQGTFMSNSL